MDIIDNFSIINNQICLNSYKLVIRHYKDIDKKEFVDKDYYVNDDRLIELETQIIPKHKLLELISKVKLDNEQYSYMSGLEVKTQDFNKEINEIASYGSKEAYEASLPEYTDEFMLDIDVRVAMMEHGRSYGLCKKIVAVGKMSKEKMLEKFDVLVLSGGLTDDDYKELVAQINNLSE